MIPRGNRSRGRAIVVVAGFGLLAALPATAQQLDPNVPVTINEQGLAQVTVFVDRVLDNVINGTGAADQILDLGRDIWRGIAVIIIVWTGLQIAFSGQFQPWQLVRLVLTMVFPVAMLQWYDTAIPGVGLTFPRMIAGGGDWIAGLFGADIVSLMISELTNMGRNQLTNLEQAWSGVSIWQLLRGGTQVLTVGAATTAFVAAFGLGMIVAFCVLLAQVLFAKLAISILIGLGPIFIPFMIVPKMDFLFWGWFKNLLQYALYSAIAVIMMRVWSAVMLGYITTFAQTPYVFQSGAWMGIWGVVLAVIIVGAIASSFKIGDIAGGIVGAGSDGGGFIGGALVASRIVATPARAAAGPIAKGMPG